MMLIEKKLHQRNGSPRKLGIGLVASIAISLLVAACSEEEATPIASPPLLETGADMVMLGLRHNITVDGVREGEIFADSAFFFRDSSIYYLRKPQLNLYTSETGVQRARVTADGGRYDPNTRELLAQGNVVLVITGQDKRIESEELNYDPNGDRIWSDSATVMTESGRVTEGLTFQSDLDFRRTVVGPGSIRNTGGGGGAPD